MVAWGKARNCESSVTIYPKITPALPLTPIVDMDSIVGLAYPSQLEGAFPLNGVSPPVVEGWLCKRKGAQGSNPQGVVSPLQVVGGDVARS